MTVNKDSDSESEVTEIIADATSDRHNNDPHLSSHYPNAYPRALRKDYLFRSIGLMCYGCIGIYVGEIYIPLKRGDGIHLIGTPMLLIFISILFSTAYMISVIFDHYDKRDNEKLYKQFFFVSRAFAWLFLILGVIKYIMTI